MKVQAGVADQARNAALWDHETKLAKLGPGGNAAADNKLEKLGFHKLDGATLRTARTPAALVNSQELFKAHFMTEVKAMTDGMEPAHVAGFTKLAEARLGQIVDATFGKMQQSLIDGEKIKSPVGHMRAAGKLAESFMKELRPVAGEIATKDIRAGLTARDASASKPQLFPRQGGGFNLVRTAPQIENLVLKGGGAKGIGYPPALKEMAASGMLTGLKQVIGTSAGALTAVSIAAGQSADDLRELAKTDLKTLIGTDKAMRARYPDISFASAPKPIAALLTKAIGYGEANKMIMTLDKVLGDSAAKYLNARDPLELVQFANAHAKNTGQDQAKVLDQLSRLTSQDYDSDRTGQMLTFSDMRLLHALAPETFKEIQLTGYDKGSEAGVLFSADRTPDLPVAYAARISMAHPLIATGVTLDPKFGLGDSVFADGGIASNSPTEAVYAGQNRDLASRNTSGDRDLQETHAKTALMIFDDNGKGYTALHTGAKELGVFARAKKAVEGLVAGSAKLAQDGALDKAKERSAGPNAFVVFHGNIKTTQLDATPEEKAQAEAIATLRTLEQIKNRENEAYAVEVSSVNHAFTLLTDAEKRLVFEAGEPKIQDFSGRHANRDHTAAKALYDLSAAVFGG